MSHPKSRSVTARASAAPALFPLQLTSRQRTTLLQAARLPPPIDRRLRSLPSDDPAVEFSRNELDQIEDELSQAALEATEPDRKQLAAVLGQLNELIDSICRQSGEPHARRRPTIDADLLFQFKVTLLDLQPAVWRRFHLEDGDLSDLHRAIQAAFGWRGRRQHRFVIEGIAYGERPEPDVGFGWGSDATAETAARLSQLAPASGHRARWIYEYDLGDGWRHEVLFEGYPDKDSRRIYPVCLQGELACPPESVGGPWGYASFLESLQESGPGHFENHPNRETVFDPEAFDLEKATRRMRAANQKTPPSGGFIPHSVH